MTYWSQFWSLPGPSRFLSRVVDDLHDGKNVVLQWPEHRPDGWSDALWQRSAALREMLTVASFAGARCADRHPEQFLSEVFGDGLGPLSKLSPRALASNDRFAGHILVIDGLDAPTWARWRPFVETYAQAARDAERWDRTRLLISVAGPASLQPINTDVCLEVYRWDNVVSQTDMHLLAALTVRSSGQRRLESRLRALTLANLAGWDPHLLAHLARRLDETHEAFLDALRAFATARGWAPGDAPAPHASDDEAWARGLVQRLDDQPVPHVCLTTGGDDEWNVTARLWSAQVAVLLPLVERERRRLLTRKTLRFTVPPTLRDSARIDSPEDLEIGHIYHLMNTNPGRFDPHDIQLVRLLRDVRNELAHFRTLPQELLSRCLRVL